MSSVERDVQYEEGDCRHCRVIDAVRIPNVHVNNRCGQEAFITRYM